MSQSSIKYISSLLDRPENISDGDHNSVALFRQTFPYFVPARYIQAAEKYKKAADFTPGLLSEIQPYMGNWLMLCTFLEGTKRPAAAPWADKITDKRNVDVARPVADADKPAQKVPGFLQQAASATQPKQLPKDAPKATPPPPPVIAEVKKEEPKVVALPVVAEVKKEEPKVVAPQVVTEVKKEEPKVVAPPVVAEVKKEEPKVVAPPVIAEVKKEEPKVVAPPVVAEVKKEEPKVVAPPVVAEVKKEEPKVVAPPVIAEVKKEEPKVVAPQVVTEVKKEEPKVVAPPVIAEVKKEEPKVVAPPIVAEVKKEEPKVVATPVVAEVKKEEPKIVAPQVVTEVKKEEPKVVAQPVVADVKKEEPKVVAPVIAEVKKEEPKVVAPPVVPVAAETKPRVEAREEVAGIPDILGHTVIPEVTSFEPVLSEVKITPQIHLPKMPTQAEALKEDPGFVARPAQVVHPLKEMVREMLPTRLVPAKVAITKPTEPEAPKVEAIPVVAKQAPTQEPAAPDEKEPLINPVYTEDYFLQQGVKVSLEIPEEIDEFKEVTEIDEDEDKSLMVMMSFSEWLLHFKNNTEKQKEEKKDQKALKTMWQKEKLAAAMEEENEEIPENVFEMAVNSITKEDGLASESLADIYIKQGKYDKAIEMYRKLSLRNPKKNAYFARRIEEVLKEKQS